MFVFEPCQKCKSIEHESEDHLEPALHDPLVWVAWQAVDFSAQQLQFWLYEAEEPDMAPKWAGICLDRIAGWSERLSLEYEGAMSILKSAVEGHHYAMPAQRVEHMSLIQSFRAQK